MGLGWGGPVPGPAIVAHLQRSSGNRATTDLLRSLGTKETRGATTAPAPVVQRSLTVLTAGAPVTKDTALEVDAFLMDDDGELYRFKKRDGTLLVVVSTTTNEELHYDIETNAFAKTGAISGIEVRLKTLFEHWQPTQRDNDVSRPKVNGYKKQLAEGATIGKEIALPSFESIIEQDGEMFVRTADGRHRIWAAREFGLETILVKDTPPAREYKVRFESQKS